MRQGGGFGESSIAATHLFFFLSSFRSAGRVLHPRVDCTFVLLHLRVMKAGFVPNLPGNEQVWPSGPTPSKSTSTLGNPSPGNIWRI